MRIGEERRQTPLLQSFNHAFRGLVAAVRHQRNMRVHLVLAFAVLFASIFLNLSRLQFVADLRRRRVRLHH